MIISFPLVVQSRVIFSPGSYFLCPLVFVVHAPLSFLKRIITTAKLLNLLRSNSDQRQISLCKISAFSVREVMRIKDKTTQHEYFLGRLRNCPRVCYKSSVAIRKENLQCGVGN